MADDNTENQLDPEVTSYIETPKFNDFIKYYTDRSEKETYGNATKSAIKAYNLDPIMQYAHARVIGHRNVTKANFIFRDLAESQGFNFETWVNVCLKNAAESKMPSWWDRWGQMARYYDKKPDVLIQQNTQINATTNIQIEPEKQKKMQDDFYEFLDNKYRSPKPEEPTT